MRKTHLLWTRRPRSFRGRRVTSVAPVQDHPGGSRRYPTAAGAALIARPALWTDRPRAGGIRSPACHDPHRLRIGAHVRPESTRVAAAERPRADLVQIFLGDPQGWKEPVVGYAGGAAALRGRRRGSRADAVRPRAVPAQRGLHEQPDPHPVPQAAAAARRRGRGDRRRRDRSCTAATSLADDDPRRRLRQLAQGVRAARARRCPVLIENTAGGDHAMARRLDAIARLWDALDGFDVGLLPRHLPRLGRRHRPARRGRPGQGDHRPDRPRARQRQQGRLRLRRATGTTTSAPGPSTRPSWSPWCAAAGAPVVCETPGGADGQGADIAFLRERLPG